MVRKVTFPELESQDCAPCGPAPNKACIDCKGTGTIPPLRPMWVLAKTLNPTKEEMEHGGGVDMAQMALNYPIVQSLKDADGDSLFLTPEQWEHLKTRINITKWLGHNDDIYLICQAVLDAEDIEAKNVEHLNRATKRQYAKDERRANGKRGPGRPRKEPEPEATAEPTPVPAAQPPLAVPEADTEPVGLPA